VGAVILSAMAGVGTIEATRGAEMAEETNAEFGGIGKVKVTAPRRPVLRDLTNPAVIRSIWEDADRAVRADRVRRAARIAAIRTS
jgi:hypothetical protein